MPAVTNTTENSPNRSAERRRRSSTEMKYMGLNQYKRSDEIVNARKASLHEQYATSGFFGKAWDKFTRGI